MVRWAPKLRFWKWHKTGNLHRRFVVRVLAPPFVILLLLGLIGLWQIDTFVRNEALSELDRSAASTSAKLEREFAIRQTILKRTGEELFTIKSQYQGSRKTLDQAKDSCSTWLRQKKPYQQAPNGICDPFLAEFASKGGTLTAIQSSYVRNGTLLAADQQKQTNERLSAYKQFFPETVALVVVDSNKQLVSSALSDAVQSSSSQFVTDAVASQRNQINGKMITTKDFRLAVFAYKITGGSVLAAYDLNSESFIKQTWQSTPLDRHKSLAVILDSSGRTAYPSLQSQNDFVSASTKLQKDKYVQVKLRGIQHIAVGAKAGESRWQVVVASPETVVFSPVRDAQLAAVLIIGTLLIGFLWVGSIFIHRTVRSILNLVGGALVFAGGKLDYKIELHNSDQEFSQLASTMNIMAERIAAAEKEIDEKNKEFISIATHELRTPLTAIGGYLSMVAEDYGDMLGAEVKPLVDQAYKGTERLRVLVNDMLDMARLEGGRVEFVIAPQDMKALAKDVVASLAITSQEKNIQLQYNETNALTVLADAAKLRIVLNNFVSNAIKYNRDGGSVTVSHTIQDNHLVTSIADTGLGIPEEQKAHMFEKFFRVKDKDRENVTGTGLGMYITKQYIEAMGGKLWFESTHGQGTTFYFSLPIAAA
jgi:signal transduction histidine kinase